jgi:hypothetical protein
MIRYFHMGICKLPLVINNVTYLSYFSEITFLLDEAVYSKHVHVIRCDIWPRFRKRCRDGENEIISGNTRGIPIGPVFKHHAFEDVNGNLET